MNKGYLVELLRKDEKPYARRVLFGAWLTRHAAERALEHYAECDERPETRYRILTVEVPDE